MAGRFPGADDVEAFWRNLCDGVESIRFFRPDELDSSIPAALRDDPGYVPARGVLDHVECFDAGFFGIAPLEAQLMDPQHRHFLETAWHALQMAGVPQETLRGSKTGVFVGAASLCDEYWQHLSHPSYVSSFSAIGTSHSVLAGRISYLLDLHGPSVALDTACSSSLVAVHLACQNLRERRCDLALAGLMQFQVDRARRMMLEGKALLAHLEGRFRLEIAITVQGGLRILEKLEQAGYDMFRRRPVLAWHDWPLLFARALR